MMNPIKTNKLLDSLKSFEDRPAILVKIHNKPTIIMSIKEFFLRDYLDSKNIYGEIKNLKTNINECDQDDFEENSGSFISV